MWFESLLRTNNSRLPGRRRPGSRPIRRSPRLSLEQLESRTVLSAYTAASPADLIADINAANKAGGANTIALTAATTSPYVLTKADNSIDGPTGLPVIAANDNLTIVGILFHRRVDQVTDTRRPLQVQTPINKELLNVSQLSVPMADH